MRTRGGVKNGHFWAYVLYGWPPTGIEWQTQRFYKVPLDTDCRKDKVMQIFGKKLIQISRNLGKMIWWQGKQREK